MAVGAWVGWMRRRAAEPRLWAAWISGLATALAFPEPGWAGLAWVGPGLLFLAVHGVSPRAGFRLGYHAGLVHFLFSLAWLRLMPFPAGAYPAWVALSMYLALYWALWAMGVAAMAGVAAPEAVRSESGVKEWAASWRGWLRRTWSSRAAVMVAGAAWWVGLEGVRGRLFSGFPWNFLGVSQWRNAPLLQAASAAGVYGVSFIVAWASLALASSFLLVGLEPSNRRGWLAEARIPLVVLLAVTAAGFHRLMAHRAEGPSMLLALVQPAVSQEDLWNRTNGAACTEKLIDLSRKALATGPDALVWPEGMADFDTREPFDRVLGMTTNAGASWFFGADDSAASPDGESRVYYNAAWMVDPGRRLSPPYRKRRLVIFGEYVPLARWLPFLRWLTPIGPGFASGERPVWFTAPGPRVGAGAVTRSAVVAPVICFEDIFPSATRDYVRPDTDFLLELTNDAWFRESSAQWQHAANAALRSVENGVPLVRCANNGVTCWFDDCGRLRDVLGGDGQSAYGPGFLLAAPPLAPAPEGRPETFYHRHGDWFPVVCLALGGFAVSAGRRRR